MYVCIYIYICICKCVYIYIYIHMYAYNNWPPSSGLLPDAARRARDDDAGILRMQINA